jgi:hypothetical protein
MVEAYHHDVHSSFIKNSAGDSALNVMALLAHIPLLMMLASSVIASSSITKKASVMLLEFGLVMMPLLLLMTYFADVAVQSLLVLSLSVALLVVMGSRSDHRDADNTHISQEHTHCFLDWFKGAVSLMTCLAILAVDFQVFPRRSAKSDTFGLSLMDMGGSFCVISSALTSKWSRESQLSDGSMENRRKRRTRFALKNWFCLLLGVTRFISVKILDYPEIVDEYGVHWNFFITLAGVWALSDMIHMVTNSAAVLSIIACCILLCYQWLLSTTDLSDFIFFAERDTSLFAANREGVISLLACYLPLYLLSQILARKVLLHSGATTCWSEKVGRVAIVACALWIIWFCSDAFIQQSSRRLANSSFFWFSLAAATTILALFMLCNALFSDGRREGRGRGKGRGVGLVGLQLAGKHSLEVFLFANVCTGVVNMSIDSHEMADGPALVILTCYAVLVFLFPRFLDGLR